MTNENSSKYTRRDLIQDLFGLLSFAMLVSGAYLFDYRLGLLMAGFILLVFVILSSMGERS